MSHLNSNTDIYKTFENGHYVMSAFVFRTLAEMAAATSVHVVAIIEPIIQHADWFFPEGKT